MTLAAVFLGGARSRLLPASVPLRFFAAAAIFHVLMWIALFASAEQATSFRGGAGPALAAIHLLTLGVLTTTAIGASVQLLPVATRRALAAVWPIKLVFWLIVPGSAALALGMHAVSMQVLIAAAFLTTAGLLLFAALLAETCGAPAACRWSRHTAGRRSPRWSASPASGPRWRSITRARSCPITDRLRSRI